MKTVALSELISAASPICYGILMPGEDTEGGVPVVKVRNYDHRGIDVSSLLRASPEVEAPFRRSRLAQGDILMSIRGTTGMLAIVPPELQGANITQDTARIRIGADDATYVFQALQAPDVQRQIRLHTIGQAVRGINIASVRKLQLPWPDQSKRRAIANLMNRLDQRIELFHTLYEQKETFKRSLARQLLSGKRRFKEFKKDWHNSFLGTHVKQVTRRNLSGSSMVLTASGEHGLVDQRTYFNRSVAGSDLSKYYLLKRGEFAYNRSSMNGYPYGATKRLDAQDEGALSTLYLCFEIADKGLDSDFLKHVCDSGVLNRQLRPIVRIGARAHGLLNVSDDDFFSISIPYPELKEQKKISKLLNSLDVEIGLLVEQRQKLELYKRGLLTYLFAGDIPAAA